MTILPLGDWILDTVNSAFSELDYSDIALLKKSIFGPFVVIPLLFCTGFKEILFQKNRIPWSLGFR